MRAIVKISKEPEPCQTGKVQRRFSGKKTASLLIRLLALGVCGTLPFASVTQAATANVLFGTNLTTNNACVVIVRQGGTMTIDTTPTQMSSKNAGGSAGVADVFSISNYDVTLDPPPFFLTSPAGGNDNVTFTTTFSGTSLFRGRNFADQDGAIPVRLRNGFSATRITAHLTATRPDAFPAGNYQTVAILRCE